jgi:hypothetical protein
VNKSLHQAVISSVAQPIDSIRWTVFDGIAEWIFLEVNLVTISTDIFNFSGSYPSSTAAKSLP